MLVTETVATDLESAEFVPVGRRTSLITWLDLYLGLRAHANAENTLKAKKRDIKVFLGFFAGAAESDELDLWTRSITGDFVKALQRDGRSPASINRILATLRHCASWVHRKGAFLAGNPMERIGDVAIDDPEWKGLARNDVTRLKAAAEQLIYLKRRRNQQSIRDFAVFHVLLHTGLAVSELLRLDLEQFRAKCLVNVKRRGRKVTREISLAAEARDALNRYIEDARGREPGPLFLSRSGRRLARQNVDSALKAIASQANTRLPDDQKIKLHAHALRHTCLRRAAEKHGVRYAMELSGQSSERYVWRYIQLSSKESARKDLY